VGNYTVLVVGFCSCTVQVAVLLSW